MKQYEVIFSDAAESDFDNILHYIAESDARRAIGFVQELRRRATEFLATAPNATSTIGRFRYFVVRRYILVYEVDEEANTVRVVMITEGHRDWRRMIEDLS